MDIEDIYYKKYLKYKLKYLELKQNGGGLKYWFKNTFTPDKEEIYGKEQYDLIEIKIKSFEIEDKEIEKKEKKDTNYKKNNEYKKIMLKKILDIEEYLLNTLLPVLYTLNTNDVFINVYKEISNTIINYREYFYLHSNKQITIENIIQAKQNIEEYLNSLKISKFLNLRKIIKLYFKYVNDFIQNCDSFTYNSSYVNHSYDDEKTDPCLFTYIDNNIIKFENNSIFEMINIDISNKLKNIYDFTSETIINEKIDTLKNKRIETFYNIKKLLKLQVLYTFKNNNKDNNIDNIMMLINCYIIIISLFILMKIGNRTIKKDLYLQNLLFKGGDGGEDENKKVYSNWDLHVINSDYDCDKTKYNILKIFDRLKTIYSINSTDTIIGYKTKQYKPMKYIDHRFELIDILKTDIEKHFTDNQVLTDLKEYVNNLKTYVEDL